MKILAKSVTRFAVCLAAKPEEDLIPGKIYVVLADREANRAKCLRIVDESGEDYLYPANRFLGLRVPLAERPRLLKTVRSRS